MRPGPWPAVSTRRDMPLTHCETRLVYLSILLYVCREAGSSPFPWYFCKGGHCPGVSGHRGRSLQRQQPSMRLSLLVQIPIRQNGGICRAGRAHYQIERRLSFSTPPRGESRPRTGSALDTRPTGGYGAPLTLPSMRRGATHISTGKRLLAHESPGI